ncbi:TonB-dependent receptor [Sinomicrobium pectinilyticum]|uniref:TonB-dependent receptor n=1 Tax=Sinomicrobium pectinilyticum TaxID=1084421 RepID=A0A3N0EWJ0_SINP1|nr:TonB-dependent receptor [Sinomicrobium pectinilyticum]RNL92270.1 TonB-dependent receptor [Sinomicrobium pectinilyticum]
MKIVLLLPALFFFTKAFAQEYQLRGKVTDVNDNPLPGVNIFRTKLPRSGSQTDENGQFVLNFPEEGQYELTFSHISYTTRKVNVKIGTSITDLHIVMEESGFGLDEVVIVSNRDKETRAEVPSSISVLTSKQIDQIKQYSNVVSDIVARIPGVSLANNRQQTRGQKLRGRSMLVLVDGIPQSTPLFVTDNLNYLDPSAIERIEVVKGSTSIYGNGAQGGIINYITKKGNTSRKMESHTNIGASSFLVKPDHTAGMQVSQFFNGQAGKVNYIIGGSYKQFGIMRSAKGEISSPRDGIGESEWYNLFSKIGFNMGNGYGLELMYNYFGNNQKSQLQQVPGMYGETPALGVFGERDPGLTGQGVKYNHNLRLSLNKTNIFKNTDLTATYYLQKYRTIYASYSYYTDLSQGYIGGQPELTSDQKGLRVNFNSDYVLSDRFKGNIIYGLDILSNKTAQPMADGRLFAPEMDMKNYAGYLQVKAKIDDFIFKGGGRYEIINISVDDYTTIYRDNGEITDGGLDINGGKLDYNAFTFNLGVRYNKLKFLQPYASFSQSFSVGELGRILRIATDPDIISENIRDTKAVITDNLELGLEGRLTRKIRYGVNYFINKQKLGTTYTINPQTNFFELSRLPEKIYGAEFELNVIVNTKLDLDLSLSTIEGKTDNNDNGQFNDSEDEYIDSSRISPSILRGDINYKITPEWHVNLAGTYIGNRDKFQANEGGGYTYGHAPVNNFFLANLFTSYQLTSSTRLMVGIENLFNKDYYPLISQWSARDEDYIKGNGINCKVSVSIKL